MTPPSRSVLSSVVPENTPAQATARVDGRVRAEAPGSPLIEALVGDLRAVHPAPSWSRALIAWVAVAIPLVLLALLASGGFRPIAENLPSVSASARLAAEVLLGAVASISCIAAGLEWGVPGAPSRLRLLALPLVSSLGFVALVSVGDALPAPAPTMAGKREHCFIEAMAIAVPLYLLAIGALRRRIVLAHAGAGLLVGFGAAALPGVAMQLACMYDAEHAMHFHMTPALLVGVFGAAAGYVLLPRR